MRRAEPLTSLATILSIALLATAIPADAGAAPADPRAPRSIAGLLLEIRNERVVVTRVLDGSPAARAGFRPGDVVLVVGSRPVIDLKPLAAAEVLRLIDRTPGDPLRLVVGRGSTTFGAFLPRSEPPPSATPAGGPPAVGRPAPSFEATALGGGQVSLAAFRGRPVLIDFWASWCPPCREAALVARRLADQYGDRLVIVGVSLDDDPKAFEAFAYNHHLPGSQIHDGGPSGNISRLYGAAASGLPYSVLIDAEGKVAGTARTPATLEPVLAGLLSARSGGT